MHIDPIKPVLKAPGIERLKLLSEQLLSSFAFKLNLRRYNLAPYSVKLEERCETRSDGYREVMIHVVSGPDMEAERLLLRNRVMPMLVERQGLTLVHLSAQRKRFWWDKGYLGGVWGLF